MCPPRGQCTPIYSGLQTPDVEERPPAGPAVLPEDGVLEQPPGPPPFSPAAPLQDGGVLQQPPSQGATLEEEPVPPCPEGQVLDEETGLCVFEEQPVEQQEQAAEEPEEQQQPEEEQPSEESGSEEDNDNNYLIVESFLFSGNRLLAGKIVKRKC